jgi:hypothetical protein
VSRSPAARAPSSIRAAGSSSGQTIARSCVSAGSARGAVGAEPRAGQQWRRRTAEHDAPPGQVEDVPQRRVELPEGTHRLVTARNDRRAAALVRRAFVRRERQRADVEPLGERLEQSLRVEEVVGWRLLVPPPGQRRRTTEQQRQPARPRKLPPRGGRREPLEDRDASTNGRLYRSVSSNPGGCRRCVRSPSSGWRDKRSR